MKRKLYKILSVILFLFILFFVVIYNFGPFSTHGYFTDFTSIEEIRLASQKRIDITDTSYTFSFRPSSNTMNGILVYLDGVANNTGNIEYCIHDNNSQYEKGSLPVEELVNDWCFIYLESKCYSGATYYCDIEAKNTTDKIYLYQVEGELNSSESIDGIATRYTYPQKRISITTQLLIVLFLAGLLMIILSKSGVPNKNRLFKCGIALLLVDILTCNYIHNDIGIIGNDSFESFQKDSESLVTGTLTSIYQGNYTSKYGLLIHTDDNSYKDYESQFGLQGKFFGSAYKFLRNITNADIGVKTIGSFYNYVCAFLSSIIFTLISFAVYRKHNLLMAFCFYSTFLLSPWIVNFARNLYWVEFTWFFPMLIGICFSENINKKPLLYYCLFFVSILIKCLCGYEYITTIMLSSIVFLSCDMLNHLFNKRKKECVKYLKVIIVVGAVELLAFSTALIVHGYYRGDTNILNGVIKVLNEDALRRTAGGAFNNNKYVYYDSFNSTPLDVLIMYFHFNTRIIGSLRGELFVPIVLISVSLAAYNASKKEYRNIIYLVLSLLTSISWFILAKSHSYIHTHMNYVMWYFGFVQMCLYVIFSNLLAILT